MRKVQKTLTIVFAVLVILGMLAVSGHAKKPAPPPEPTVKVTGAIMILPNGSTTDPANVRVQFLDDSFGSLTGSLFPANADRSPAIYTVIMRPGPPDTVERRLRFYYCTGEHPDGTLRCDVAAHNPNYYYCLNLHDGQTEGKGRGDLNHLIFPVGTRWSIGWKYDSSAVAEGALTIETTYDVIQ